MKSRVGSAGVLAAVTAGLVIGSRLGKVLSARTRVLWLSTWKMIGFVFNGFVFVLVGLQLPHIAPGLAGRDRVVIGAHILAICAVVIGVRFAYIFFAARFLPNSPGRVVARTNPVLARRLTIVVGWAGMRGSVSLAAALALPADFPSAISSCWPPSQSSS